MGTDSVVVTIFDGIATVRVGEQEHDVWMKVQTEAVGYTIRWFGTFGWMGDGPKGIFRDETLDVSFSDGRDGKIRVPHLPADHMTWEFLGVGMPPGFEWFGVGELEVAETKPAVWRVWLSRLFALLAIAGFFAAIWMDEHQRQMMFSATLSMLLSIGFAPARRRSLPEVPLDVPRG